MGAKKTDSPQALTRESLIEWMQDHKSQRIVLAEGKSMLKIEGVLVDVEELDACSMDIMSFHLRVDQPGLDITCTFHPETLGVHLHARPEASAPLKLSIPLSIPYASLRVSLAGKAQGEAGGDSADSPEYSPYALLFPDSK